MSQYNPYQALPPATLGTLVDLLLACGSMQDSSNRAALMRLLPPYLRNALSTGGTVRVEALSLLMACGDYADGTTALLGAMHVVEGESLALDAFRRALAQHGTSRTAPPQPSERDLRLRALLADHSGFMQDRLRSFVGRATELAEIRERIGAIQPAGGYVTITGQAGTGKSSVIAKLVKSYGADNVAFHFIPFNPGPDHQVGLLRNLMARLILKYDLPDLYVASDSRAALRDYLPKVLKDVAEKGGQEIIFIDGLDQLEEDMTGVRDLSFLPTNPPVGIVFVLGTRPNDTLKPLELLKPQREYQLPNLTRADFDLVLQHRGVQLAHNLAERFYSAMQQNALYLDLVAQELAADSKSDPEVLILQIADDPGNLFSFIVGPEGRLTHWSHWHQVGTSMLGYLLAAAQPLSISSLHDLLGVPLLLVKQALTKLGGLVARDGSGYYFLFHLKLQEYLQTHVFAASEVIDFHLRLAHWADASDVGIWQVSNESAEEFRRVYGRAYYVFHLAEAHAWDLLWAILDDPTYGWAKIQYDPSMRSYAQDLNRARNVLAHVRDNPLRTLPRLWKYSLLRSSLSTRVDKYPDSIFPLLAQLNQVEYAINLSELLTDPSRRVIALLNISQILEPPHYASVLLRASEIAQSIENELVKLDVLSTFVATLIQVDRWDEAKRVALSIQESSIRDKSLLILAEALVAAQHFADAEGVATSISSLSLRDKVFSLIAETFVRSGYWVEAERLTMKMLTPSLRDKSLSILAERLTQDAQWGEVERMAENIQESALRDKNLSILAEALAQSTQWVEAERVGMTIISRSWKGKSLLAVAKALAQNKYWAKAERIALSTQDFNIRHECLFVLIEALVNAQDWAEAERVTMNILTLAWRDKSLTILAKALAENDYWAEAERVALTIQGTELYSEAIYTVAKALIKANYWLEAERVAMNNQYVPLRAKILFGVAKALAQKEYWTEAKRIALSIQDLNIRHECLLVLTRALINIQYWTEAEEVSLYIQDIKLRANSMLALADVLDAVGQHIEADSIRENVKSWSDSHVIVEILAKRDYWSDAEQVALRIQSVDLQDEALRTITNALVYAQHWNEAERVALRIHEPILRGRSLFAIAKALSQIEDWVNAERLITCFIGSIDMWFGEKAQILSIIALGLVEGGHSTDAERVVSMIQPIGQQVEALKAVVHRLIKVGALYEAERLTYRLPVGKQQIIILMLIAQAYIDAGLSSQARQLLSKFERRVHSLDYIEEQDVAIAKIAQALIQEQKFQPAREIAYSIRNMRKRSEILLTLSCKLAEIGAFDEAEHIVYSLSSGWEQVVGLVILGQVYGHVERVEEADYLLVKAEQVARSLKDHWIQSETLLLVVQALVNLGNLNKAEQVTGIILECPQQSQALYSIMEALLKKGLIDKAKGIAYSIPDLGWRFEAVTLLANTYRTLGMNAQSDELASNANQLRNGTHRPRWRNELMKMLQHPHSFADLEVKKNFTSMIEQHKNDNTVEELSNSYENVWTIQQAWLQATTRDELLALLPLATPLIRANPALGMQLFEGMQWVDDFLKG